MEVDERPQTISHGHELQPQQRRTESQANLHLIQSRSAECLTAHRVLAGWKMMWHHQGRLKEMVSNVFF